MEKKVTFQVKIEQSNLVLFHLFMFLMFIILVVVAHSFYLLFEILFLNKKLVGR